MDWALAKQIAAPLAVAAIIWLFWFAYHHPKTFEKTATVLSRVVFAVYVGVFFWMIGYSMGAQNAYEFLHAGGKPEEFDKAPLGWYPIIVLVTFQVLIFALGYVHKLRDEGK